MNNAGSGMLPGGMPVGVMGMNPMMQQSNMMQQQYMQQMMVRGSDAHALVSLLLFPFAFEFDHGSHYTSL
jgi:hypothetical protein